MLIQLKGLHRQSILKEKKCGNSGGTLDSCSVLLGSLFPEHVKIENNGYL